VRPFRGGRIHRFGADSTRAATDIHIPFILQGGGASSPGRCPGLPSPADLKACLHWWRANVWQYQPIDGWMQNANTYDGRDESRPYNSTYAFVQQTSV